VASIVKENADRLMVGVGGGGCAVPLPVRATGDGLPEALWATDKVADLEPADEGANVTDTVCAAAPALTVKVAGLTVNCAASAPDTVIPDTVSAAAPVLDTVKVSARLCPTCTSPKLREAVEAERPGAVVTWK